jgi:triosephosphate isomerase
LLAYEPIWAIGVGGKKVTEEILEQSVFLIKKILHKKFGESSKNIKIIYGGSVDETNILKLSKIFGVDGFLLGRAGLDSKIFMHIVKNLD